MPTLEAVKCPNCGAPLEVEAGVSLVRCEYCRVQSNRDAEAVATQRSARGPRLTEAVSVEVTEDLGVVILERGTFLPVTKTEVFATSRDAQASLEVKLRVGNAERPADNRPLASFSVPLVARGPRGTVAAGVTFVVAEDGSGRISVKERGVDDAVTRDVRLPATV
jgi:molecular chaperone DnaK (HSP70)